MAREHRNYANLFEKMMNNPQQVGSVLTEASVLGDWRLFLHSRDVVAALQAEQVAAAAGRYFKRDNRTVGAFLPEDQPQRAEIPAAPSAADRAGSPMAVARPPVRAPRIARRSRPDSRLRSASRLG